VSVPTIDERRIVAVGTRCEQRDEEIQIQKQDTFQTEPCSDIVRDNGGFMRTTMSPPWTFVDNTADPTVRDSHVLKPSFRKTGG
jgi:hypothetical protein